MIEREESRGASNDADPMLEIGEKATLADGTRILHYHTVAATVYDKDGKQYALAPSADATFAQWQLYYPWELARLDAGPDESASPT